MTEYILLIDLFSLNVKRLKQFYWRICCEWRWVISCQIKSLLWLWLDSCLCRADSQPVLPQPGHGKQVVRTQESGQMGQEGQEVSSQAEKVTIAAHKYQTSLLCKDNWRLVTVQMCFIVFLLEICCIKSCKYSRQWSNLGRDFQITFISQRRKRNESKSPGHYLVRANLVLSRENKLLDPPGSEYCSFAK